MVELGIDLKKKKIIDHLLNNDILVTSEIIDKMNDEHNIGIAYDNILRDPSISDVNQLFTAYNKDRSGRGGSQTSSANFNVRIMKSYDLSMTKKITVQDFVSHLKSRYKSLEAILRQRIELANVISINRILSKRDRGPVAFIGTVTDKQVTKNNNIFLSLEDVSGEIKVLISKDKKELFEKAQYVVLDEVLGILGSNSDKIVFANELIFPEVPLNKEFKKCGDDVYALFMGDIHLGSRLFLKRDFDKFIRWIRGEAGSEKQRSIAKKVGYIFIVGDLIEGVGVYPGQDKDLDILDVTEQYDVLADKLRQIPEHIKLIVCPGNHDTVRIAEPQPSLNCKYAKAIISLPNVISVSSPSYVNFHFSDKFPGFDVLLYHGYSFPFFADAIEPIRMNGGQKNIDKLMKVLMQKRHLAPTHTCNLFIPFRDVDHLVVEDIPDFFVTGHIHRCSVSNYRNVSMLNCSCWADISENQVKLGLVPQPSKVIAVNLSNRNVKILNFRDDKKCQE